MTELREMAGLNDTQANDSEVMALREEAEMPIDELMSKLKEVCKVYFHLWLAISWGECFSVTLKMSSK